MLTRRQFIGSTLGAAGAAVLARGAARAEPRWQIGCYTRPWAKFDYRLAFDGIAEAGFRYAGLMTASIGKIISVDTTLEQAAEIGAEARKRGLELSSTYGGPFPIKGSIAEGVAGLRRLIDNTSAARCPSLLLGGTNSEELEDAYYTIVAECCDYASEKGVELAIKPHGGLNSTGRQCRRLIEKVGHPNFGLWYDPGNIFHYSQGRLDPVDDVPSVNGLVDGMCIKDFRPPAGVNTTPGTGLVDFPTLMTRLRSGGFTGGPLVVEAVAASATEPPEILAEAKKARRFLEELVGRA